MCSDRAKEENFVMNKVAVFFGSGGGEDRPHRMANQNWVIEVFVEDVIRDKVRVAIFSKIGKIWQSFILGVKSWWDIGTKNLVPLSFEQFLKFGQT